MLALSSFIHDPDGFRDMTVYVKDICKGFREFKNLSMVACEMVQIFFEGSDPSVASFFFKFDSRAGLEAVLEGGPWLIRKSLIILKKWSMDTRLLKEELTRIPIWVKLHDVPIQVCEEDGISLIATFIGKPVMLDSYTSSMCNDSWGQSSFARCLIEVNFEADLIDVVTVGVPSLSGEGFTKETMSVDPPIATTSNVVTPIVVEINDGFQMVGKKKKKKGKSKSTNGGKFVGPSISQSVRYEPKAKTSDPKKGATYGNASKSSSMLKTADISSKKDNFTTSNSFSALNNEGEDGEENVENELWNHQELSQEDCSINGVVLSIVCLKDKIFTGHLDGTIKIWSGKDKGKGKSSILRLIHEIREHTKAVTSLMILPSGSTLYSGLHDKTIREWSINKEGLHFEEVYDVKEHVNNLLVANNISCFIPQYAGIKVNSWTGESKLLNPSKDVKCLDLVNGSIQVPTRYQEIDLATGTLTSIQSGARKLLAKGINPQFYN
ncbi:zinc knuckle CX2CX4HX4C containing protein [Tanacetum coccineum]